MRRMRRRTRVHGCAVEFLSQSGLQRQACSNCLLCCSHAMLLLGLTPAQRASRLAAPLPTDIASRKELANAFLLTLRPTGHMFLPPFLLQVGPCGLCHATRTSRWRPMPAEVPQAAGTVACEWALGW